MRGWPPTQAVKGLARRLAGAACEQDGEQDRQPGDHEERRLDARRRGDRAADQRPMKNPNATELALKPNTVLWAAAGVSSPIIAAVAGMITPLNSPFSPTATTTNAAHGATPTNATASAISSADAAAVRTYPSLRVSCV